MSIKKLGYEAVKERILEILHENPETTKQDLVDKLGVPYHSLYPFLRRTGIRVPRPKRNRRKAPHLNSRPFQVLGYLMNNPFCTLQHVADQFGCTREYVSQIEVKAKAANIRLNGNNSTLSY